MVLYYMVENDHVAFIVSYIWLREVSWTTSDLKQNPYDFTIFEDDFYAIDQGALFQIMLGNEFCNHCFH